MEKKDTSWATITSTTLSKVKKLKEIKLKMLSCELIV
jgi:hypothetical protein